MKNNLVIREPLNIFVKLLTGQKPVFRGANISINNIVKMKPSL